MPKRAGAARLNAISSRHYNQIIERFERLGTWAWDVKSGAMRWSEGLFRALGKDPAAFEPTAEAMIAMAHPDDRWTLRDLLSDIPEPVADTVRFAVEGGGWLWLSCHREVFRHDPDAPVVIGVMHDVTALKAANSLSNQRSRLIGSLVSLLDGMTWRAQSDGTVVFDIGWCEFTGTTLADNRGDGWLASIHPDDREGAAAAWTQAVRTQSLYATSYRVRRADGAYRRFEARAAPMRDEDATVTEWVGYCALALDAPSTRTAAGPVPATLEPAACRAARALLGWSVHHLAVASGVSSATITRHENPSSAEDRLARPRTLAQLRETLERSGVAFIARPGLKEAVALAG